MSIEYWGSEDLIVEDGSCCKTDQTYELYIGSDEDKAGGITDYGGLTTLNELVQRRSYVWKITRSRT